MTRTEPSVSIRLHALRLILAAGAASVVALAGCEQGSSAAGGPEPAAHEEGDGHDHAAEAEGEHADEVTLTAAAIERYGVTVQAAQLWNLRPTVVAPARAAFNAEAMAHVGSVLSGRIVDLPVRLGDAVNRGHTLAVVESKELGEAQAEYLQLRAVAETTGPTTELARVAWERAQSLFQESQGISLTEVQRREAEHNAALANQRSTEASVVGAENRLHILGMDQAAIEALAATGEISPRSAIAAPIAGHVVQREVTLGELVGPDRESIMVLADTSVLWVLADVPEARLHQIAVGATAWVTTGAVGSEKFEGQVGYISPLVDLSTRTAQVRIEMPEGVLPVRPGMFVHVEIVTTPPPGLEPAPVIAVPEEAVQTVEGGPAVFVPVAGEPNTFARRAVQIGPAVGGLIPIYAGLAEGELYVVSGSFILKAELGKSSAAHEH
jgi:cobalt-zinc-cadmium efflux system membrane fusion protein